MPFKILSVDLVTTVYNINSVVLKADPIRFKLTVFQRGKYDNRFWSANHKKKINLYNSLVFLLFDLIRVITEAGLIHLSAPGMMYYYTKASEVQSADINPKKN